MNAPIPSDDVAMMLRDSIERYAQQHSSFEQRRGVLADPRGYSAMAWSDYAGFGWLALRLPESAGGIDGGAEISALLMESVGARLLMEPLLASAIIGAQLLKQSVPHADLLPRLADGSLIVAFAHHETLNAFSEDPLSCELRRGRLFGTKLAALHADCADRLIVSARDGDGEPALFLLDARAPQLRRTNFRLLDGRGAANLHFDGVEAQPLAADRSGAELIGEALDEAAVALCSEALGAMRALNAATLQYLKVRKQFGRPIGSNQALQHRMVEMVMLEREARALCFAAQRALGMPAAERARIISGARAYITGAARRIANESVQMHGGIGVTDELDVSHYYRRLMVVGTLFGNRDWHFARFTAASEEIAGPPSAAQREASA